MTDEAPRRALRIGLTGPIGCGKSTVGGWLGELGATVIDADRVAREVTEPGTPALAEIAATFGRHLVRDDGSLDRAALGRVVFADPAALAALERIVHPAVRPAILARIEAADRAGAPAVVVEAIKLVEGGLADLCDAVWLVTCDPAVQRDRLAARGDTAEDAAQRVAAQGDVRGRLASSATHLIDTTGSLSDTLRTVRSAWDELITGGADWSAPNSSRRDDA